MIDFFKIDAFEKGRRDSFESLICVLAKREPQKAPSEFQANDGRGGDGGVEALWVKSDGGKIGYQAKYFKTLGDSQWRQMDESVEQALVTHPQLVHYVFALPFDLTPDRGPKARGKSQREKWTDHVNKWKDMAAKESITVDFELWGATELTEKILRNENSSIYEHWFGADLLDDEWFQRQVGFSTQKLDDRFNPEDHVGISLEQLFDTIVRGPVVRSKLCKTFESIASNQIPTFEFSTIEVIPDADWLLSASQKWDKLLAMQKVIDAPHSADWNWDSTREILSQLLDAVGNLERPLYSINRRDFDDKGRNEFEVLLKSFRDLSAALDAIDSQLRERNLSAESMRTALVVGEAGSGKSHCFAQVANDRISDRSPTILLLGQDFSNTGFWEQLGGLLGLKGRTSPKILGSLNAAGERKNERTLLLFDAINEGVGASYWRHWVPEFIEALKPYRYLAAVFSCRDAYLPYALPEALLKDLPQYTIYGFSTPDERERAAIQYLDKKGISRPNTTWLSPEFSNPLFLKTTSESLLERVKQNFPAD